MSFPTPHQTPIRKNTQDSNNSPESKTQIDLQTYQDNPTIKLRQAGVNEIFDCTLNSHHEPSSSVLESSEFVALRPAFRNAERVSTVVLTSESVLSRNRLQECSVHLERLIEHSNTLTHSKKFEDKIVVAELPGLHSPVFTSSPTIAFCNKCGRDVRTRIRKVENKILGFSFFDYFCCFQSVCGKQEFIHSCSRCRNELIKVTM
jgi:hypothetical protein